MIKPIGIEFEDYFDFDDIEDLMKELEIIDNLKTRKIKYHYD